MHRYVIADASVLIIFDKIDHLDLLRKLYQQIYTTPEIAFEFKKPLPDWIVLESPIDKKYQNFIATLVDEGEASALTFAIEREDTLLILDDLKARKLAKSLNLKFTGTLGVINRAKREGVISEIKPLLDKIQATDFRVPEKIISELLHRNGE